MKSDTPEHLAVFGHCAVNMDAVAEIRQVRLPCILTGTPCGRCLRQAKTCCSDERFLLENVPVRARGRRAHDRCTREVELDDGGQTLMINYYSALLYCGKILILQQNSLVRGTRSAALPKQKVNTWYRCKGRLACPEKHDGAALPSPKARIVEIFGAGCG